MALDDYRRTVIYLDRANQYREPVRLNPDDLDGRIIKAVVTDDHAVVTPSANLQARLTWNDEPTNANNPGNYRQMSAVTDDSGTAAWETPIPESAARTMRMGGEVLMGVQILDGDTVIASRPFTGLVDRSVMRLDAQGENGKNWFEEQVALVQAGVNQVQSTASQVQSAVENFGVEIGTVVSGSPANVVVRKNNGLNTLDFTLPQGEKGETGDRGPAGIETVRVSQLEPGARPTATISDGVLALGIPQGLRGERGPQGNGLLIKGSAASADQLPASGNEIGDARLVGTHVYVWYTATGEQNPAWHDAGELQGPSGHGMWTVADKTEHATGDVVPFTNLSGAEGVYRPIAGDAVLMPSGKVMTIESVDATAATIGEQYANLNVGEQGPQGPAGVTEVTVEMLATDAQPTTKLDGQHLTLGIPRGQQGIQGVPGPSGVQSVTATVIESGQQPSADFNSDTGALTLKLPMGGVPGPTPTIGANGNWFLDGVDSGKPSRGDKGDPGAPGETGPAGVTSATVTMLNPGSQPTVSLSNQQLRLGIPKGDKGEAGKDGISESDVTSLLNREKYATQDWITQQNYMDADALKSWVLDNVFPKGCLFLTLGSQNPGSLVGGNWEQVSEGRFLIGAGGSYSAGNTGGNSSVKLTTNEMPRHQHAITLLQSGANSGSLTSVSAGNGQGSSRAVNTDWQGGGAPFSIIPPYLAVTVWQRIG